MQAMNKPKRPLLAVGHIRKFKEAADAQAKGKTGKANWALNHIQKLYRVETAIKAASPQERHIAREKQSTALLE